MNEILPWLAGFSLGYLFGSVPFGLLLTRAAGHGDVRAIGSGNIGATNVLRTGSKGLAALTLLLDALKAAAAIWLAQRYGFVPAAGAALGAFCGHLFPVWLSFKGGKGVAVFVGALLAVSLPALLVFAVAWIALAYATRYSSLAALVATIAATVAVWLLASHGAAMGTTFAVMTAMTWWAHRANLVRLRAGTESRIGGA